MLPGFILNDGFDQGIILTQAGINQLTGSNREIAVKAEFAGIYQSLKLLIFQPSQGFQDLSPTVIFHFSVTPVISGL